MARVAVRGFRASYSRSAIRLKAIAVERAPTMAAVIQTSLLLTDGNPFAASTAPEKCKRQREERVLNLDHFERDANVARRAGMANLVFCWRSAVRLVVPVKPCHCVACEWGTPR